MMTEYPPGSCGEAIQKCSSLIEAFAARTLEALTPAFQRLTEVAIEWHQWYVQQQREMLAQWLIDGYRVPSRVARWVAARWPEEYLPDLWDDDES